MAQQLGADDQALDAQGRTCYDMASAANQLRSP
jgi:hypothetical protein